MAVAHVIGLGRSGIAAARLLRRQGWQVSLSDAGHSAALVDRQQQLEQMGIQVYLDTRFSLDQLAALENPLPQRVIVSPGVPWDLPSLVEARQRGIEMMGELEFAWRNLRQFPWIGITGTNGKTTTTALTAAILQRAGLKAPACGNIGYSACELALAGDPLDWVVAEISSYQIESASTLAPKIGVWTTFSPDHLERHGSVECYRAIKAALINQSEHKVLNGDDAILQQGTAWRWPEAVWTLAQPNAYTGDLPFVPRVDIQAGWARVDQQPIVEVHRLKMHGVHNQQNMLLAIAAAHLAGVEPAAIAEGIATFPGVPHRLEQVGTCGQVNLINDSKATNYEAAQTGLAAVQGPTILIAGGDPKKGDDRTWIQTIHQKAAYVLLIGNAAPAFAQRLHDTQFSNYEIVETMDRAVTRALELAKDSPVQSILLSPACASFDQYPNFEKRGDHFKALCQPYLTE
ncbi:UDP-N-acetylmuramoyl-L-alanine--D-glutamate ligase [Lyngbya confervoides]|uniref:UDP-N-acetylmuramoylalanine--D-glutamate ligase n=1 Tax=Lyngbya confervoides BDU141951 TaxID=1574623 RepID=A0ABD4T1J6_9CYAN|nr:UDP-N-acetylmuramoyl-L-alanine--D-glutamate ligase [Lyngbya confervoides]MCM1982358.1 UDP-N-acetylmuramoyl-L-alanine--D-glutamate ligase [Lyngbya confervoides BDU141951]